MKHKGDATTTTQKQKKSIKLFNISMLYHTCICDEID
jgi:hypothetical protein